MGMAHTMRRMMALGFGLSAALVASPVWAEPTHEILLTNGTTVKVEILSETETEVSAKLYVGSMSAPRTFQRSEIIQISELTADGTPADETIRPAAASASAASSDTIPEGHLGVFVIELNGDFGWDISKTPVQEAMQQARSAKADVVIVKLNNNWRSINEDFKDERFDDEGNFDDVFTAEQIIPSFTTLPRADWDREPRIVFWVDRAMSGAAFLPLLKSDIYFTSNGRMGGVGNLDELFGSTGDEVVRDKQKSLRQGQVEGYAIEGGHDPVIVRAMTKRSVVLWYRLRSGKTEFHEGEQAPDDGGWIQLTDNGEEANRDTDEQIVRLEGNDTLNLDAETAFKIGLSKGTADTVDDLLFQLGIDDRAVVLGDSDSDGLSDAGERVSDTWSEGITSALRTLRMLQFDLDNVPTPELRNDPTGVKARNAVRGQQIRIIDRAIQLLNKYGEVLDPNEQNRVGLELRRQQIENEKRRDRIGPP